MGHLGLPCSAVLPSVPSGDAGQRCRDRTEGPPSQRQGQQGLGLAAQLGEQRGSVAAAQPLPIRPLTGGESHRGGATGPSQCEPAAKLSLLCGFLPPRVLTSIGRGLVSGRCSGNVFSFSGGSRACNSHGSQPSDLPLRHLIVGHIESRLSGLRTCLPLGGRGAWPS